MNWDELIGGLGPSQPLTAAEVAYLEDLADSGRQIPGLTLVRRAGETFVERAHGFDELSAWSSQHSDEGSYEAAAVAARLALRFHSMVHGTDHPDNLVLAGNWSNMVHAQGDTPAAHMIQSVVFPMCTEVFGPEHQHTLTAANNLAGILRSQGDFAGARALQESVYQARQRVLGPEHPETLTAANNLAATLLALGDLPGARRLFEWELETCRRVLGAEDPETLISANNLAETLRGEGDFAGARRIQEEVLEVRRRIMGEAHPQTLISTGCLAETMFAVGDLVQARRLNEIAHRGLLSLLGPEHPSTLSAANNLSGTLRAQGDLSEARRIDELVYETRLRLLGPEHPDTLISANNLAATKSAQGDVAGARQILESGYEILQRILGLDHRLTLSAANNLAHAMSGQRDFVAARRIEELILDTRLRVLGPEHPDTLTSASNLARTLLAQGDLAGAHRLDEMALEARERLFGPEHQATLNAKRSLAMTLHAQGDLASARQLEESVLETCRRVLGPEHPDTITSANNLASTMWAQGELSQARALEESVLESNRRLLGPEHPNTMTSACNLAITMLSEGDLAACVALTLSALREMTQSVSIEAATLERVSSLPLLADPSRDWPASSLAELLSLVPAISEQVQRQLRTMVLESGAALYKALTALHERWCVIAFLHLPAEEQPAIFFAAIAPLHGPLAWAQLREAAAASHARSGNATAQGYLLAEQAVQQAQLDQQRLLQDRNALAQESSNLQYRLSRVLRGEAGVQTDDEPLRRALESLRLRIQQLQRDLQELTRQGGIRRSELARAERDLAEDDPELARQIALARGLDNLEIQARLREGDLWLVLLPERFVQLSEDPERWDGQLKQQKSFAYALRHGRTPQLVELQSLQLLAAATGRYRRALRGGRRGILRDGLQSDQRAQAAPWGIANEAALDPLAEMQRVRGMAREGFWEKLQPYLEGVRQVHFVSGPGQHDVMIECGQPESLMGVQLLRFCGLPAYGRRTLDAAAPVPLQERVWVHDTAWDSGCPIPFAALDSLISAHRHRGRSQEVADLLQHGPHTPLLLLASHGEASGSSDNLTGCIVLGQRRVEPSMLVRRSGWSSTRALISLSCFGGLVGASSQGDAHGVISALQGAGLQWAIACLAPVEDFYSPLFSAVLHHELDLPGADPARALANTKQLITRGPWNEQLRTEVMMPLRQGYRDLMLDLLQRARHVTGDDQHNDRALLVLRGIQGWPLPGQARALQRADPNGVAGLHQWFSGRWCASPELAERLVEACLDDLFKGPSGERAWDPSDAGGDARIVRALDNLCAVTVFFGQA